MFPRTGGETKPRGGFGYKLVAVMITLTITAVLIALRGLTDVSSKGALAVTATGAEIVPLERMSDLTTPAVPEITDALETVQRYGVEHPSTFAGALGSGAVIYAGFTGDRESHLRRLQELVPDTRVQVFAAEHTHDELIEGVKTISADLATLGTRGILISGVGVDTRRNRVHVMFGTAPDPRWRDTLAERYGADLLAFEEAPKTFFSS